MTQVGRFEIHETASETWRIYDRKLNRYRYTETNGISLILRLKGLGLNEEEQDRLLISRKKTY